MAMPSVVPSITPHHHLSSADGLDFDGGENISLAFWSRQRHNQVSQSTAFPAPTLPASLKRAFQGWILRLMGQANFRAARYQLSQPHEPAQSHQPLGGGVVGPVIVMT